MNPDPITLPYLEGKAAGLDGLKIQDCPYRSPEDWRRPEWIEGFWAGVDERKAAPMTRGGGDA